MPIRNSTCRFAVRELGPIRTGSDIKESVEQRRYKEAGAIARGAFQSHIEQYGMRVGMIVQSVHDPSKQYQILEITKPSTLRLALPGSDLPLKSTYSPVVFVPAGAEF